jgi:hypothetical protein
VEEHTFSWGLTASVFALLLVFSTWHGAWWRPRASPAAQAQPANFVPTKPFPANPFLGTSEFQPAPNLPAVAAGAAENPRGAVAPVEEQSAPSNEDALPDTDYQAMAVERNRGHEHGSRTH